MHWGRQAGLRLRILGVLVGGPAIAALALYEATPYPIGSSHFLAFVVVGALVLALTVASVRYAGGVLRRGPIRLRVKAGGFEWGFGRAAPLARRWRDAEARLLLGDYRKAKPPVPPEVAGEASEKNRTFGLTAEALDALVEAARSEAGSLFFRRFEGLTGGESSFWDVRGRVAVDPPPGWSVVGAGPRTATPGPQGPDASRQDADGG